MSGLQTMTKHAAHGDDNALWGNRVEEQFTTYALRARFVLRNRWRTTVVMPLANNRQLINAALRSSTLGIGDPTVIQMVNLLNPYAVYRRPQFAQRLEIGAGVKVPLGAIDKMSNGHRPHLDLQPGTGSWDVLGLLTYWVSTGRWGGTIDLNGKWNTANEKGYRYGATLNSTLQLFYQLPVRGWIVMPTVGGNVERAAHDRSAVKHKGTGGTAVFLQCGWRLFRKKMAFFGEYQRAAYHRLNGHTQLINKYKINAGLTYYL